MNIQKAYKSGDFLPTSIGHAEVGINGVIIFHPHKSPHFEFWKDADGSYHVGLAYKHANGEEFRYRHFKLGENKLPKKWAGYVCHDMKKVYDEYYPLVEFTRHDKQRSKM